MKVFRESYINKKERLLLCIQILCPIVGMVAFLLGMPMFLCVLIFGLIDFFVALRSTRLIKSIFDGTIIEKTNDSDKSFYEKRIATRTFVVILLSETLLFYPILFSCLGLWKEGFQFVTILFANIIIILKGVCLDDLWRILKDIKSDIASYSPPPQMQRNNSGKWVYVTRPELYDVEKHLKQHDYIDCIQRGQVSVGDVVYLYIGGKISRIKYKMSVSKVGLEFRDLSPTSVLVWNQAPIDINKKCIRLKLIQENKSNNLSLKHLRKMGVLALMRRPFRLNKKIEQQVERCFNEPNENQG